MPCARSRSRRRPMWRPDAGSRRPCADCSTRRGSATACVRSASRASGIWSRSSPARPAMFSTSGSKAIPIKAILGFDGIVGTYASPYAAGTGYVLLHHCFGETNGRKGVWGHALGGMGAITQAMARACAARGRGDPHGFGGEGDSRREWPRRRRRHRPGREDRGARGRLEPPSEADLREAPRPRHAAGRLSRPHRLVAQRLGRVPHEPRARRAAELLLPARARGRGAPRRGNRYRAKPRLYGARLDGRAPVRLVRGADRRNAHSLRSRRLARAARTPRRLALLPACRAVSPRRALLGRGARGGRRPA